MTPELTVEISDSLTEEVDRLSGIFEVQLQHKSIISSQ
jgi:hypothetical protein